MKKPILETYWNNLTYLLYCRDCRTGSY